MLRKAFFTILVIVAGASAGVCLAVWIQIDADLEQSYFKAVQSQNQPEMRRGLDSMVESVRRVKTNWYGIPFVSTSKMDEFEQVLLGLRKQLDGQLTYQVKGDLMKEYRSRSFMEWFPYGYMLLASLILILLVGIVPEIHLRKRLRRAWYKRYRTWQVPRDFKGLV